MFAVAGEWLAVAKDALSSCLVACLPGWLAGWLAGWLFGWSVACLAGWLVGRLIDCLCGSLECDKHAQHVVALRLCTGHDTLRGLVNENKNENAGWAIGCHSAPMALMDPLMRLRPREHWCSLCTLKMNALSVFQCLCFGSSWCVCSSQNNNSLPRKTHDCDVTPRHSSCCRSCIVARR